MATPLSTAAGDENQPRPRHQQAQLPRQGNAYVSWRTMHEQTGVHQRDAPETRSSASEDCSDVISPRFLAISEHQWVCSKVHDQSLSS